MRLPRYFRHNDSVSVAFRLEEGLLMRPLKFINELIWSCIAVAQEKYPIDVIAFCFEANHAHLVLTIIDPEDLCKFIQHLKQELSHRLNRMLGKRKHTNWCKSFSGPVLLTKDHLLQQLAYGLTNPVKDNLICSLDEYPGVSSWPMLRNRKFKRVCRYTSRDSIPRFRNPSRPWLEDDEMHEALLEANPKKLTFELTPYAWKRSFEETAHLSDEEIHEMMVKAVKDAELEAQIENQGKVMPTATNLIEASLLTRYIPKKFSQRMVCLSTDLERRKQFIQELKSLWALARQVYENWKRGDYSLPFPPGMYPPAPPRLINLLPALR